MTRREARERANGAAELLYNKVVAIQRSLDRPRQLRSSHRQSPGARVLGAKDIIPDRLDDRPRGEDMTLREFFIGRRLDRLPFSFRIDRHRTSGWALRLERKWRGKERVLIIPSGPEVPMTTHRQWIEPPENQPD